MQRSDIIQAAAHIFRRKGYHAASMQDIAEAVKLQKASLYHHVESKQEILVTILDQALDLLITDMEGVVASELPPVEKLRRAMHVYIERLTQDADLAGVLLLEYRSLEADVRSGHISRRDHYEGLWRQLIHEGVEKGVFRSVDEHMATFAVLGVLNWMITWYRASGRFTASELADEFTDLFSRGLCTTEGDQGG